MYNSDYKLPTIPDNLPKAEQEHRNKYRNLYIKLINRCSSMTEEELSNVYTERHHIVPKCMGGENNDENLVKMPVRYHIMAHIILVEVYPDIPGLRYAIIRFLNGEHGHVQSNRKMTIEKHFSTRLIAKLREDSLKNISGENHPSYGKPRTEEFKRLMSHKFSGENNPMYGKRGKDNPNYGKPLTEDRKKKISASLMGKSQSVESNLKRSLKLKGELSPNYGKKLSLSTRQKISENHADFSGGKNGRARKVQGPNGTVYGCIKDAALAAGVNKMTLSKWLRGLTKENHGWKFLIKSDT